MFRSLSPPLWKSPLNGPIQLPLMSSMTWVSFNVYVYIETYKLYPLDSIHHLQYIKLLVHAVASYNNLINIFMYRIRDCNFKEATVLVSNLRPWSFESILCTRNIQNNLIIISIAFFPPFFRLVLMFLFCFVCFLFLFYFVFV